MDNDSGQPPGDQGSSEYRKRTEAIELRWQHYQAAIRSAHAEIELTNSDRACVLVSVSLIDTALEVLIRTTFLTSSKATQKDCDFLLIKRPMPPLGSASIRARLAFVLGLIDKETLNAISYAIEKRNEYAHQLNPPQLTHDVVAKLHGMLPAERRKIIDEKHDEARKRVAEKEAQRSMISTLRSAIHSTIFPPSHPQLVATLLRQWFAAICLDLCIELHLKSIKMEFESLTKHD